MRRFSNAIAIALLAANGVAWAQFPPSGHTATQPATTQPAPPPGAARFQDGVYIDWKQKAVLVDGRVVLRDDPLEFIACFAGKEHESVVRLLTSAVHIYQACGLIGLEPGHPPRWNEATQTFEPPAGALVDLDFEFERDGRLERVSAFAWTREVEYLRSPRERPWVFAGSVPAGSGLAADSSGAGVAVVDFGDALFCLSRHYSESNAELWLEANPATSPPLGTFVRMRISAALVRPRTMRLDFRGDFWIGTPDGSPTGDRAIRTPDGSPGPARDRESRTRDEGPTGDRAIRTPDGSPGPARESPARSSPASPRPGSDERPPSPGAGADPGLPPGALSNERWADLRDLADSIRLNRAIDPSYVQEIRIDGATRADAARLRKLLEQSSLPADAWRLVDTAASASQPSASGQSASGE